MCSLSDIPCVEKVVDDISSFTIEGVKREFLYMYKYKDNVNILNAKMEELGVQEEKIKIKVERDTDDGKIIENHVLKWQQGVQQIKGEVEEFLRMDESKRSWRCLKVLHFPNLYSRFRMGREVVKKTEKVNGLTNTGIKLADGEISYRPHFGYADLPSTTSFDNDYVSFKSREDAYKKILEAFNNKDVGFIVGIYGMAGAGKTRMMEQAWKQAKMDGIFDEIARADVSSEKLDVRNLQGQLASCLNLHLPLEENEEMRASLLANRLTKKGNKILVLFDDVWEELPLNKIGVPFGDGRSKGCKILLTSRNRDVCFKNNCEDAIEIKVLKEEEGWGLFKKNVGSSTITSLESLAKKVCDECACLPLVIAVVGKALKGKPYDSWKDALDQLQDSKLENIDGIDPKVYTGLELSFNHLQKDAKSCLFLCSVFPEDAVILIKELARLVKANRLIEGLGTLEIAKKRVRSMVVALKNSSLLLPYNEDDTKVKLHDIIRNVAKSVAAKDPAYAFLEKSCGTKWSDVEYYKDRKLISLSFDNINYFPREDDLACPELHTLVVNLNGKCQQFPEQFFNGFPKLRVLVLNGWSISHLPSSLQSLTNLRMLSLYNADLNMSLIKELKDLEMLIILDGIEELSLDLRELKCLQLLDMSRNGCRNMIMPRHLLSSLSNLEELYIPYGFSPRGKEEKEEGGGGGDPIFNPIHHELSKLTNLTTLHILLPDVMFLPIEKICQKLLTYVIDINPRNNPSEMFHLRDEKRVLRLCGVAMQGRSSSLEILLESVEYMELESVNGFQTYFNNCNHGKAFANLANLSISFCDDLEYLGRLPQNYQQLPHHQPMRSFSKLTELRIANSGFKYLFCPSSARCLGQLQKLFISFCRMMEEIICPREQEEEKEIIEFPNLKDMGLNYLPRLKSFYCKKINMWSATPDQNTSTFPVHSLFNGMVSFPVLKELIMYGIENVIEIWEPQCHTSNSFSQLKVLSLDRCDKLENVIPFAMLRMLQNMETLEVQYCSSLKCIVNGAKTATTEDQEGSDNQIVFPVLQTLTLWKLRELDNFWCTGSMGSNTDQHQPSLLQKVSFPRLEKLWIWVKLNWEHISLGDSAYQLRSLRIYELYPVFPPCWLVRLQNVETLFVAENSSELSNLVDLMGLNANLPHDHGIHDLLCFRRLKNLYVVDCNLSTLFTCSLAKTNLQQLEELTVRSCKKMEEIVSDENEGNKKMVATGTNAHADEILIVFPWLKTIEIEFLPVLKSFCGSAIYTFNMPSLERVVLRYCPLMINFTCRQLTTPKFIICDNNWDTYEECTDLNKYLQTLLGQKGVSLIKPTSADQKDLEEFLYENPTQTSAELQNTEPEPEPTTAEDPNQPRLKRRATKKPKNIPVPTLTESLLDMPISERTQILRTKKKRAKISPLTAEELRVPSTEANHSQNTPVENEETDEPAEPIPQLVRKRKHTSDNQPTPSTETPIETHDPTPSKQPTPPPQQPTIQEPPTHIPEAVRSPTLWPDDNEEFPLHLYNHFVLSTDDHRFGDTSTADLVRAGMIHQARANGIFGRLNQKYREIEAEERAARRESELLKAALAKERNLHANVSFFCEGLKKDNAKLKDQLKAAETLQQTTSERNFELTTENEVLKQNNQTLTREVHVAKRKKQKHFQLRGKVEKELRELRALGPPLTEELKNKIRSEYRKSPELTNEIIQMYAEGYEAARSKGKLKLAAAALNPLLLDSSEDEDEDNAKDDPPPS